jgi:adenylate kinase family enzyme
VAKKTEWSGFKFTKIEKLGSAGAILVPLLGMPGSGKDTKGNILQLLIKDHVPSVVVNVSLLIDQHIAADSPLGRQFAETRAAQDTKGVMAPDIPVMQMIERKINEDFEAGYRIFLVNSAPRTVSQARSFVKLRNTPVRAIHFQVSKELVLQRIERRREEALRAGQLIDPKDDPANVSHRLIEFQNNGSQAARILDHHRQGTVALIDSTWPVKKQVIHALRHLDLRQDIFNALCRRLDDHRHQACQEIARIETQSAMEADPVRCIPNEEIIRNHFTRARIASSHTPV